LYQSKNTYYWHESPVCWEDSRKKSHPEKSHMPFFPKGKKSPRKKSSGKRGHQEKKVTFFFFQGKKGTQKISHLKKKVTSIWAWNNARSLDTKNAREIFFPRWLFCEDDFFSKEKKAPDFFSWWLFFRLTYFPGDFFFLGKKVIWKKKSHAFFS